MRILMLSQFYPPIIGGGALHVQSLSSELASRGHDVIVVTLWHEGLTECELDQGVPVYRIRSSMRRLPWLFSNESRQYAPPFPDPEVMLALRRIIGRERPEIVHAHNWLVYSFLPLKAWSGAKLVVTLHNYSRACAKTTLMRQGILCDGPALSKCLACSSQHYGAAKGIPTVLGHRIARFAEQGSVDMYLTVSQATAAGNGLVDSQLPFQVIPNFMPDIALPQEDCASYLAQLPAGDYLLFAGAFSRQKGVDVLLRAYAGLVGAPPLVLIGYQTPDWQLLSADCPANVIVLKNWPRHAVIAAWRRSALALAPSVGPETFGMAVMEAMTAACPVIASRVWGLTDLVADGETGLLIEPGDAQALQRAIERLLESPDLRRSLGEAARQKAAQFQARAVVPRIEHVYQKLLQSAAPSQKTDFSGAGEKATTRNG